MREKILNSRGVSLITLSISVIIVLIITGTIIYNLKDNLKVEKLEQMHQDIENLSDKVDTYYAQYGAIPIKKEAQYTNISAMQEAGIISEAVDTGKFYVIDLQSIENLTLSFGQDYENVKNLTDSAQINEYTNLYIINEDSHNIFYPRGIIIGEEKFYTNYTTEDVDTEAVVLHETNIEDNWSPEYDENGKYIDKNDDTAIIPEGFKVSRTPGMDTIYDGLVIQDKEGNEFVWVPVDNFSKFKREHFGTAVQKSWIDFVTDGLSPDNMYEPVADGINVDTTASSSEQEVQKMYKSVKDNGGFYIARYEAGNDGSNNVLCKKGVNIYNNIGWADTDDMTDEIGGAVEKARGFSSANSYTSVTSTLVYGVQWDAVLRWINKDDELKGYLIDSTRKGNYLDSDSTNNPAKTGTVEEHQLKNIYDMAGNVFEWTMESYKTNRRVYRGGDYSYDGDKYPVSNRSYNSSSCTYPGVGFRVALYINI